MSKRKIKLLSKLKDKLSEKLQDRLYCSPDYRDNKEDYGAHRPPDNPRYPDPHFYGGYASKNPPPYVPHPYDHTCFKPREEDYKPPTTCEDHDDTQGLCARPDHRTMTVDQQDRFLNAFTQINIMNALGPLVDIHANAVHQMHGNPRFLPWHRIYLLRMEVSISDFWTDRKGEEDGTKEVHGRANHHETS